MSTKTTTAQEFIKDATNEKTLVEAYKELEKQLAAREVEIEAQRQQIEALQDHVAHLESKACSDVPNVPLAVVFGEGGEPTSRSFGFHADADIWAYSEAISFAEDAGYAFDPIRDRAYGILHRAFHQSRLGTKDRGGFYEFEKLPKFSPSKVLRLIVWIGENN